MAFIPIEVRTGIFFQLKGGFAKTCIFKIFDIEENIFGEFPLSTESQRNFIPTKVFLKLVR